MSIRRRLKEIGIARAQRVAAADVRVGLIYTAVYLDNGRAGLAYTFPREWEEGCRLFGGSLPLCGKPASELIPFLDSQEIMIPEAFSETPVMVLSVVVVTEPFEILRIVSEGGGMRLFKNYIQKANIRLP